MRKFEVYTPAGTILVEAEMVTYGDLMYSFRNGVEGEEIIAMFTVSQIYGWREVSR